MMIKTGIVATESMRCVQLVECEHAVYDGKNCGKDNTEERRNDG